MRLETLLNQRPSPAQKTAERAFLADSPLTILNLSFPAEAQGWRLETAAFEEKQ